MNLIIDQIPARRLVVVITDHVVNNKELAHHIYWLASHKQLSVLYLVLVEDSENLLAVTRDLVTMKAVTSANSLQVEAKAIDVGNWLAVVQKVVHSEDIVLCQEEQMVVSGLFKTVPISEFLSSHLNVNVRTIPGFSRSIDTSSKNSVNEFFALIGFLCIIALFTWLQIRLDQALDGTLAKIIIMITVSLEIAAVWAWNKFTYRQN